MALTPIIESLRARADQGKLPTVEQSLALAKEADTAALVTTAAELRDRGFHNVITYSRKVFIPLTQLCRDVCHYCAFAQVPRRTVAPYLRLDEVLASARHGAATGCREALFTLGEKPELRHRAAREALTEMGFESTLDYLAHVADAVLRETGLLPHLNPGTMTLHELKRLRPLSPSMGIMLESTAERLGMKGMPHHGSPDKVPVKRLQTLEHAGELKIPFTTGILIGIGETRIERIESLLAVRDIHQRHGHVQEIIIQSFRAKPDTRMAAAPEPDLHELLWTIAVARIIFGPGMSIQAPPNLSPGVLVQIVAAGINDWGGVSPLTPDFVNPEAPWPHIDELARETAAAGKLLSERLTIYPRYTSDLQTWVAAELRDRILKLSDTDGFRRTDDWYPGADIDPPPEDLDAITRPPRRVSETLAHILDKVETKERLQEGEVVRLFRARGDDFSAVVQAANRIRQGVNGETVSFCVNRNINYTNICYFKCQFCAFSKGKLSDNLRGQPHDLSREEIQRRAREAWTRGATEVCMQGGIHPKYTGETYIDILRAIKEVVPGMHLHAFSPLEVWQGAATLNTDLESYLLRLRAAGLDTLPGTAAEILDDEIRRVICPDKINTEQWLRVMATAHKVGFRTTATIMYGHMERLEHWARHLLRVRDLQAETGGFTEFVPLPFVPMEAPMYRKGKARRGPTFREAILMHSVARLVLHPLIPNIQVSWVKMGQKGVLACLNAGCNDLGGTLMNESISRAAGSIHGQETSPQHMRELIETAGRTPRQRTTLYQDASAERMAAGLAARELIEIVNTPVRQHNRTRSGPMLRPGLIDTLEVPS